jgi:hypothetical protein
MEVADMTIQTPLAVLIRSRMQELGLDPQVLDFGWGIEIH